MNLIGIQIISFVFATVMAYFSYLCYKKHYFGKISFVFWILSFTGLGFVTLFPSLFTPLTNLLNITRNFDLLLVIGLFFVLTVSFLNFLENQKLKKQIINIVQQESLKNESK